MNRYHLSLLAAALLTWGCNRGGESKDAVRQAIVDHLSTRSGLSVAAMQIEVVSVKFRQNEADATVSFRPKGGGQGMEMNYTLERKGSRWTVKGRQDSAASPHGAGMAMPPGAGAPGMGGGTMPPGHPPMTKQPPPDLKK